MKERLLTTREVSNVLRMPEKDIIELASANLIPHFKVAGEFLRFRKDDVSKIRTTIKNKYNLPEKRSNFFGGMLDFFYFNDFYIACSLVIFTLLWVILKDILSW